GYAKEGYRRNLIKKNDFYELVAVCWLPGQLTPIHDHVGSDCAFKIIATGGMGEVFYSNSEIIEYYDADLTLDGLNKLYKKIK
ncbi:MAG: hypothetical protein HON42_01285, partial [Alphaproteobacteria bacterium]|nr:hypothetical protein [Alphaproteobacteria bacterium]